MTAVAIIPVVAVNNADGTANDPDDAMMREILLVEYKALRDEISKRMDHRVTFRISALTLTLAAIAVGVERKSGVLLLLAPIVSILFSNIATYVSLQIDRISGHLRSAVEPKLNRLAPDSASWHAFEGDRRSRFRQTFMPYHLPMLILVVVPTSVAVGLGWTYSNSLLTSILITAVDAALFVLFLWNYYRLEVPSIRHSRQLR
ncbi:hypothetical protein [Lentzea sp. NPDC051838]|uniref:hypothetical protein n=1 Tax=Lentzea sp. NPDC051838 TaxID=3154849 RepID=UPI00341E673A